MDKGFVQQSEEAHDEPRLLMLETVHEYAWEALAEHEEVEAMRGAHAAYYLRLAEEAEHRLLSPEQENLRAALAFLIEQGELETALRFATALWRFWSLHGHHREGYSILEHLLTAAGPVEFASAGSSDCSTGRASMGGAPVGRSAERAA